MCEDTTHIPYPHVSNLILPPNNSGTPHTSSSLPRSTPLSHLFRPTMMMGAAHDGNGAEIFFCIELSAGLLDGNTG